jgi:hypothetical protein
MTDAFGFDAQIKILIGYHAKPLGQNDSQGRRRLRGLFEPRRRLPLK